MLVLRTLGGLFLEDGGRPIAGAASQRGRLAILAVLAATGGRGVSRETIHALFWPEADKERARGALNQALYALRRDTREPGLILGTTDLRLNPLVIRADVAEFNAAVAGGDYELALDLYRGEFLNGIHVQGAEELEEWQERERQRLAGEYRRVLDRLARAAGDAGDHVAAVRYWRLSAMADPLNANTAKALMGSLAAAGEIANALQHAHDYDLLVHRRLGTVPDPSVAALAGRLRQQTHATPPPLPPLSERPGTDSSAPAAAANAGTPSVLGPSVTAAHSVARRHRIALLLLLGLLAAAIGTRAARNALSDHASVPVVAVLPLDFNGPPALTYLGAGFSDLLERGVASTGSIQTLGRTQHVQGDSTRTSPPSVTNVTHVLNGKLIAQGDRIRVSITLSSSSTRRPLLDTDLDGAVGDLFSVADRVVSQVVAALRPGVSPPITRSAASTTSSLLAFREFIQGEEYFLQRRMAPALEAFESATRLDSTFAMAFYRLSQAADFEGRVDLARQAAMTAARHAGRLPTRNRLLLTGHAASLRGDTDHAEQTLWQLVRAFPDDVDGTRQLGELLFHVNPFRGRSATEAQSMFQAVAREQPDYDAWTHVGRILALKQTRETGYAGPAVPSDLKGMTDRQDWWRDFASGRGDWPRVRGKFSAREDNSVYAQAQRTAVYFGNLERAEEVARLLTDASRPRSIRALGWGTIAELAIVRGRMRAADTALEEARKLDPVRSIEREALLAAVLPMDVGNERRASLSAALRNADVARDTQPDLAVHDRIVRLAPTYLRGLLAARSRDSMLAWAIAANLEAASDSSVLLPLLARSIRALLLSGLQQPSTALAELEYEATRVDLGTLISPLGPLAWQRFLKAALLAETGRAEQSLQWYRTLEETSIFELMFLAPALLESAAILQGQGLTAQSIQAHRRATSLWRDSDPAFRELRAGLGVPMNFLAPRSGPASSPRAKDAKHSPT